MTPMRAVTGQRTAQMTSVPFTPVQVAPIPVAVAHPVANLITGMLRPATVLAAHSAAVVLCVEPLPGHDTVGNSVGNSVGGPLEGTGYRAGGGTGTGSNINTDATIEVTRVVTLLTREASGVPNGVRTALRAADQPFLGISAGDAAFVGAGGIRLQGRYFHAVRTIRTRVAHIVPTPTAVAAIAAAAAASPRGVADEPVNELRTAIDSGDAARLRRAVRGLVGLGGGSTPGGDDVIAGTLAGLKATRRDLRAAQVAAAALPDLDTRTPLMSADLLRLAAEGHVCTEAGAVLRAAAGPLADLDQALQSLFAVGHTSGADLATGLAIGLGASACPEPRKPRRSRRGSGEANRHSDQESGRSAAPQTTRQPNAAAGTR